MALLLQSALRSLPELAGGLWISHWSKLSTEQSPLLRAVFDKLINSCLSLVDKALARAVAAA